MDLTLSRQGKMIRTRGAMTNVDSQPVLISRAAFADRPVACASGRGIVISDRDGLGLAMVLARNGATAALKERMQERFGVELPLGPYRAAAGDFALAGIGPDAWLATFERGGNDLAVSLRQAVGSLASVSDQSDGYTVLRLAGPKVRDTLCKLVPIDVHPRVFRVGAVAVTVAAHMGATLWRLEDHTDGSPVFEIAVFRSMTASFWHALSESAAEFGLAIAG
jgi:methylglutamate dehydrogenase subunit D